VLSTLAVAVTAAVLYFQPFTGYRDLGADDAKGARYHQERERAELVAAIELYTEQRDRPPATLDDLAQDAWLSPERIRCCEQHFRYQINGTRWTLQPIPANES
jgi:hypothetical protein